MDIERLINSVRERPVLWDQKNKYYHNRDFVRQEWNEIAEDCGTDSKVLKNKWKNLRDTFRSELKKTRAERSGDGGGMPPFQSNWPWYELMTFLIDIMTPRKTKTNVHHKKQKLKLIQQQMSKSETQDDSYHFVVSLLSAMRKLSPAAQLRARIKIQQVLLEELEQSTTSTAHSLMSPYAPENPVEIVIAGNPQNEIVISEIQPDDIVISSHQDSENFDT
ncbi:uncharacterized protein LOC124613380 [Schistocerca americana]|uniref:uncharacterized protein LOC124613380 n=1 Tax=Schistocerca americana TaxID=7009 RepID=UPI001F4F84A0|nr:uncharacterized protein LOC124613380 [Schistocerca americana]